MRDASGEQKLIVTSGLNLYTMGTSSFALDTDASSF